MANRILNNWIVKNLLKAIVLVIALALVITVGLNFFTEHGQEIGVPDLTNLPSEEAISIAEESGLRAEVIDSVYVRRMTKGAVFSQNPKAGTKVKKNRMVRLTINTVVPKKVTMPNLIGYSMRQAKAELTSRGLTLGTLIYVDDMATNNVLKQLYHNSEIRPGTPVESGSSINLVVGLNSEDRTTYIPNVVGMKCNRAVDAVHDNSLNVKRLVFDDSVKDYADSINAVVYRLGPESGGTAVSMGTDVTLYLTLNDEKLPK